jgi:hypothetical protein
MIGQNDNINLEVNDKKKVILGFYGLFYVVLIVIIVVVGYSYLGKLETFSRGELIPTTLAADTTAKTNVDLPVVKGTTTAPVDLVKEPSSKLIVLAATAPKEKGTESQEKPSIHNQETLPHSPAGLTDPLSQVCIKLCRKVL